MKKVMLLVILTYLLGAFLGCSPKSNNTTLNLETTSITTISSEDLTTHTTSLLQLSIPSNIEIINNIIYFESVLEAEKYQIIIYDEDGELIGEYEVEDEFDLSIILLPGLYSFQLYALANGYLDSEKTSVQFFEILDNTQISSIEGLNMNNLDYVRWMGRTYYDEIKKIKYFYFTASGFEVAFYGTELKVTLIASNYDDPEKQPYVVALIDGEEDPNKGITIILNQEEAEYTLVKDLEYGYHTVKLLKRSEASDSNTSVKEIFTDGYFTTPPSEKTFNIQFIAASSSTGYGNLGTVSETKTTANSNGLLAYAYLTSYLLDSEISIFAASGWGVSRGYNTNGSISETQNIPHAYNYLAIDDSNTVFTEGGKWNHEDYIPNVIVVNLGTNDFNASNYNAMGTLDKIDIEYQFWLDYTAFLLNLNSLYPDAYIIVAYGLMNESDILADITSEIVNEANNSIGETKVFIYEMEGAGTLGNPFGSNYHPNVQTGKNVAVSLAEFISLLTGREVTKSIIE